jgi:O-antigen/teichoic acid export membrane protein
MGMQYLIPTGRTQEFTISVVIGAVLNLGLNLVLIKNFQSLGAALATVLAEIAVTGTQMYFLRKDVNISKLYSNIGKYFISGLIMFIPVILIGHFFQPSPKITFAQISTGGTVYILCLFLLKSDINTFIFTKVFSKLYKKFLARKAEA